MRRHYKDGAIPFSKLHKFVASIAKDMTRMDMRGYFEAAGYGVGNCFDASRGWADNIIDVTCRGGTRLMSRICRRVMGTLMSAMRK